MRRLENIGAFTVAFALVLLILVLLLEMFWLWSRMAGPCARSERQVVNLILLNARPLALRLFRQVDRNHEQFEAGRFWRRHQSFAPQGRGLLLRGSASAQGH
jgi:hypothetical protein